ncbi:MAG: hypothetical protein U9R19_11740 [Bacteroidota bacterium]|nr:hypothetical protein [Bacteroidota bacterium]
MDEQKHKIPELFKSFLSDKPIENCIMCEKYLLEEGTAYFIEKAFKDDYVEVEYAICVDCAENMKGSMSAQSIKNIENYFMTKMQYMQENMMAFKNGGMNPEYLLTQCVITGIKRENLKEYQIAGFFNGSFLNLLTFPFLISGEAAEEINELLSKETKGEIDGFVDDFIGLPPEWKKILKTNRPILI